LAKCGIFVVHLAKSIIEMPEIIGRLEEIELMKSLIERPKSTFLAMYGRRRIGKTFLIRNVFLKHLVFYHTAKSKSVNDVQLENWTSTINDYKVSKSLSKTPKDWDAAFRLLKPIINKSKLKKKVVFIDEVPWMDNVNSGFLSALEHFWNSWASHQDDLILVVCGSASAWIIENLVNNTEGLHNRLTHSIQLFPFTLNETKLYFENRNAKYGQQDILDAYMCMGGIPYYLDQLQINKSIAQNINDLFFRDGASLRNEFHILYNSLFKKPEKYIAVILALATKKKGLTREELIKLSGLPNGGSTSKILLNLERTGFIRTYKSFDKKNKFTIFQLIDLYTLFYLQFVEKHTVVNNKYWLQIQNMPLYNAWTGYAFEMVCLHHINNIKKGLGIDGMLTNAGSWVGEGAQIDLVIERNDKVISLVEMKHHKLPFSIDKKYATQLLTKAEIFKTKTGTNKTVFIEMLSTNGLKNNQYRHVVNQSIESKVLFW
jgi:uncharacterized protein